MPTYVYTLQNGVLAKLTSSTGVVPDSASTTPQQAFITRAVPLSADDKVNVDQYMIDQGYVFTGTDIAPIGAGVLKFSGTLTGVAVDLVSSFLADQGGSAGLGVVELSSAQNYECASARKFAKLRVHVNANLLATSTTVTLLKNGIATAMTVTIPAGSTGLFSSDGPVDFVAGERYGVRIDNTGGGLGLQIAMSATMETTPT